MALFGKKSNPQSGNSDVPPELKPYYSSGSGSAGARRSALRVILGLLIIAIIVAAGTASWRYVQNHKTQVALQPKPNQTHSSQNQSTSNQKPATKQSTTQPGQTDSQHTATTPTTSGSQQAPSHNQTSPSSTPSTQNQSTPSNGPSTQGQVATTAPQAPSQSSTLTNTGPGETAVIAALVAGLLGALLHYRRQARSSHL